jgi:hypothetical protein
VTTQSDDRVGESVSAAFLPACLYIISQAKARNERDPEFARPADGAAEGEEGTHLGQGGRRRSLRISGR